MALIDLGAYPRGFNRLFFALFPDPATAARAEALAKKLRAEHGLKGRPHSAERVHVSLQHLWDFRELPPEVLAAAARAAQSLSVRPFAVEFDHVMSFTRNKPRRRPLVLRGSDDTLVGLFALQSQLEAALKAAGLVLHKDHDFTPHMTLLYDDRNVPEQPVEPIRWTVRDFVLILSLIGQGRYVEMGRWPLKPRGTAP